MKAEQLLGYLNEQEAAIQAAVKQLDEVQVAFNAQFDAFTARHDAALGRLSEQVAGRLDALPAELKALVKERVGEEELKIADRHAQVREKWLPQRQQVADDLMRQAQEELEQVRALNPQLDEREEALKKKKAELEDQLAALNGQIRAQSRGLGVVAHFLSILQADRERQRVLGRLEEVNSSVLNVRREWELKHKEVTEHQAELQARWQHESVAVARLKAELDQLGDPAQARDLALRRAIYRTLDALVQPATSPDPALDAALREMIELNRQTDAYHEGLAAVGGLIGLLKGVASGLGALRESVQGLVKEQVMHSAYLAPLSFTLPERVQAFHEQWTALDRQFADEKVIGGHPAEFAAAVRPLVDGPLAQPAIEAMFEAMGGMLKEATARW